jgi:peptide chain release factor 2
LVEVLPQIEETPEIEINPDNLEWQFFRASSQGGQNVQKVSSAVRLIHKPTRITVTCQTQRYQEQNRKIALDLLRAKLWSQAEEKRKKEEQKLKGGKTMAGWGTQIRSYVLHPYKMVKDLRTGYESSNPEAILNGEIDGFLEAELKSMI